MRNVRAIQLAAFFVVMLDGAVLAQPQAPDLPPEAAPATASPAPTPGSPDDAPVHETVVSERKWFGYEILLMDAAALGGGLLIGSAHDGDRDWQQTGDVIAGTWGIGMVGSFAVHSAHGNAALGLAGTGARLLLPPIGAVLGVGVHCIAVAGEKPCSAGGGRGGFVFGMITASLLDSLAFARAETDDPDARIDGERVWYGYQTLMIDGAALAASLAFTIGRKHPERTDNGGRMLVFPYLTGFLVSPWVHAFHGRVGVAFASLGLRALAPALATLPGMAGKCASSGGERFCIKEGAVWGLFGGTMLVAAIDIGALSFERVSKAEMASTSVLPFVTPSEDGRGVLAGISGTM
jgi:hypothetical protein